MPSSDAGERRILRSFGQNVRDRRKERGLSQEELAAEASLDRTYMGGIERGERNLGLLNIVRVAKALGVSVSQLSEGID